MASTDSIIKQLDKYRLELTQIKQLKERRANEKPLSQIEWIEEKLYIRTKDARLIKFKLNSAQKKVYETIQALRKAKKAIRLIILKARQLGMSTLIEALIFENTIRNENTNSLITAHDQDGSENIFQMSQLYYENLPNEEKPATRYSNRKELYFTQPLLSRIRVDTAGQSGNKSIGRSFTLQNVHCSEIAFWSDAAEVMLGISQAVPDHQDTFIALESTANGVGDFFYNEYFKAKNGDSDYVAIFIPWFETEEYSKSLDVSQYVFEQSLSDEEKALKERYKLSNTQLNWRRWAIRNKCGGDPEKFKQEFPSEDIEAFLVSGRPVFDAKKLQMLLTKVQKPLKRGYLREDGFLEPNDKGFLKIWKEPKRNKRYVIGVDIAEGKAMTSSNVRMDEVNSTLKGDYSCAQVLDIETCEQVAEWHGHIDEDLFADELFNLGKYYNEAIIAPETTGGRGLAVTNKLKIKYYNLYIRRVYDNLADKWIEKYGWDTNRKTRGLMVSAGKEFIREDLTFINSKELVQECMTFVLDDNGKPQAQQGAFDDRVMAFLIAIKVWEESPKEMPKVTNYVENENPEKEWDERLKKMYENSGLVWEVKEKQTELELY